MCPEVVNEERSRLSQRLEVESNTWPSWLSFFSSRYYIKSKVQKFSFFGGAFLAIRILVAPTFFHFFIQGFSIQEQTQEELNFLDAIK